MNRLLIWFALLMVLATPSLSQDAGKYYVRHLTTENGLPSNGIKGLEWDEQSGFLWIATEAGISRFNGLDFSNFTKQNTPGLSHERMLYITKDSHGSIYTADVSGNILLIHNAAPIPYAPPELETIAPSKKRFYLSTYGPALQKKVLQVLAQFETIEQVNHVQLSDTSLLMIIDRKHAYYISENLVAAKELPLPAEYSGVFLMNQRLFAVNGKRKIFHVDTDLGGGTPMPVVDEYGKPVEVNIANTILHCPPGMKTPILFSDNNAWLLYDKQFHLEARLICSAVPAYSYIRFAQYSEKNGTLFIGTDSKGIIVINKNRVLPLKNTDTDIRNPNAYYSQVDLFDGSVLTNEGHVLGTGSGGTLSPINGKFSFTVFTLEDSLLWFSQGEPAHRVDLLHRYNYNTKRTTIFYKNGVVSGGFAAARSGEKIYIASLNGLGVLDDDSIHYLFKPGRGKPVQQAPITMIEISPGVLGVASCDGFIAYDINKKTTDTILRPLGYCIRSLWKYKDYVFVCTYGKGFYIWKKGVLKSMPLDKNKFLQYAHCVVPDEDGFCWISSNRGLFKAQLSDLIDAYEKNRTQIYYHYFGKNDGMGITEMNGGCAPCALVMKNKTISFPTMDGLLWVDPAKATPLLPEGNIYIDEFVAGDKKLNADSLYLRSIPFKARDISIRLGFSAWCNKENIYIEYRINDSERWIEVDINKGALINLHNLAPGRYRLQLRKLNGFGVDNYSYKEIVFSIRTPWRQQWWFYMLCIMALMGAITLYLKFRTNQYKIRQKKLEQQITEKTKELKEQNELLEKNNSIKTRLISIISHDIVTPLKFVTVAGKNLQEKRTMMPEELQLDTIREMTNTSQELQLLSTNILNWIKYQNENRRMAKEQFDLYEMVNQVLGILQSLARQKNIAIKNEVEAELQVYQYYEPLKILVYNLLTNAIQFTEKGAITVSAIKENGNITVIVKDEGIGMTPDQIQRLMAEEVVITSANVDNKRGHGLGFLIIKDLVKTMEATLSIESKKDLGSTISVKMPGSRREET